MMLHPQRRGVGQCDPTTDMTCLQALNPATDFTSVPMGTSAGTAATDPNATASINSQFDLLSYLNSIVPMGASGTTAPKPASSMNTYLIFALIAFGAVVVLKKR